MEVLNLELPRGTRRHRADRTRPSAKVAIGSFDGVHLGHRQVLDGCDTVLTFDPHPRQVLEPLQLPSLLSDRRRKLDKLGALGIRRVAIIPFDHAWSRLSAEDFVEGIVVGRLGAESVSIGAGFRFGARGAGTAITFESYPELSTRVVPLVRRGPAREPISSTRIRRLIFDGDVEQAAELLGAPLTLPAVVAADGRLRIPPEYARPKPGVYRGQLNAHPRLLRVDRHRTVSVTGVPPTGAQVEVTFVDRLS